MFLLMMHHVRTCVYIHIHIYMHTDHTYIHTHAHIHMPTYTTLQPVCLSEGAYACAHIYVHVAYMQTYASFSRCNLSTAANSLRSNAERIKLLFVRKSSASDNRHLARTATSPCSRRPEFVCVCVCVCVCVMWSCSLRVCGYIYTSNLHTMYTCKQVYLCARVGGVTASYREQQQHAWRIA